MRLENTNQSILKKIGTRDSNVVYAKLVPYKGNTRIKVYDEEGENEPLGDIPEEEVAKYLEKNKEILFLKEMIDDDTGLTVYVLETLI